MSDMRGGKGPLAEQQMALFSSWIDNLRMTVTPNLAHQPSGYLAAA